MYFNVSKPPIVALYSFLAVPHKNRSVDLCCCKSRRRLGLHQPSQAFCWYDTNYRITLCCVHRNNILPGVTDADLGSLGKVGQEKVSFFWWRVYDHDKVPKTLYLTGPDGLVIQGYANIMEMVCRTMVWEAWVANIIHTLNKVCRKYQIFSKIES